MEKNYLSKEEDSCFSRLVIDCNTSPDTEEKRRRLAEINLRDVDLVNMPMAIHAGADVFLVGDIDRQLIDKLIGTEFTREAVEKALEGTDIGSIILNCDNQKFINTIFTP